MYITKEHEEILKEMESAAYNVISLMASESKLENAQQEGQYNLGYIDGVSDLCENLKAVVKRIVDEKEGKKAAEQEEKPAAAEQEEKGATSKYDN